MNKPGLMDINWPKKKDITFPMRREKAYLKYYRIAAKKASTSYNKPFITTPKND
jgi:hypothetical protein